MRALDLNSLSRVYFCNELMISEEIMRTSDAKVTNRPEANGKLPSAKRRNKFRVVCEDFLHYESIQVRQHSRQWPQKTPEAPVSNSSVDSWLQLVLSLKWALSGVPRDCSGLTDGKFIKIVINVLQWSNLTPQSLTYRK